MPEVLSTELVFQGRVLKVRVDTVRAASGQTARWDVIEHPGSVSIVPIDAEDQVMLVRQYRPAIRETLLEIPAGTLELGESPEATAHRELREEIGMRAERMREIGSSYLVPGYSSELMHFYVATDLSPAPLPQDDDEDIEPVSDAVAYFVGRDRIHDREFKGEGASEGGRPRAVKAPEADL